MKNAASVYAVVEQTVQHYIDMAEKQHGRTFRMPNIEYFHKGANGGDATPAQWRVRFNAVLLKDNLQRYMVRTIPHEVAHLICYAVHGWERKNGKYVWHGESFQAQMRAFGCETTRCHDMDTSEVKRPKKRTTKKHAVKCIACGFTGSIGTVRKNKILRGAEYTHRGGKHHIIELI